jgi:hypothetical protein
MSRGAIGRFVAAEARRSARAWRAELERPWRRGRKGTAAETGRWIGLGLAVGAFVAGVGAALYAERRRR